MKATGIIRRIDDLGRVVIPKEIRRTLGIHEGDPLEIYADDNGGVVFKKYLFEKGYADRLKDLREDIAGDIDLNREVRVDLLAGIKENINMKLIEIDTKCNVKILEIEGDLGKFIRGKLNGHMEVVHPRGLKHPYVMIVDEEGLLKKLPANIVGCYLYETDKHGYPIVGNIYIAKIETLPCGERDIAGLTDKETDDFGARYGVAILVAKAVMLENEKRLRTDIQQGATKNI